MNREQLLVELVDDAGVPIGQSTVDEAHRGSGKLHRAFSVMLTDPDGRMLLQRRAATKTRFPLCWANSCCGHPAPGVPVAEAAARRLDEELGVTGVELREVGVYVYQATDPETGRVEYEYDHVLVGHAAPDLPMLPDPSEVAEVRWIAPADLTTEISAGQAPWLPGVLRVLEDFRGGAGSPTTSG